MIDSSRKLIVSAFRQLMRAVIRLALRNGVSCNEFTEICKELYVEVASHEYGIGGRPTNMSRIALMTGINRHEVKRLKDQIESAGVDADMDVRLDKVAGVLSAWHENQLYINEDGKPIDIPLNGPAPSFAALVQSVSTGGDVADVTILRELKRSQIVEDVEGGLLKVKSRYFVPNYLNDVNASPSLANPKKITFGCSMLVDHINTLFHNLYGKVGQKTRLELRATQSSIRKKDIPAFYELVNTRSMQLLEEIDHWLEQHHDPSVKFKLDTDRIGLGIYLIQGENTTQELVDI